MTKIIILSSEHNIEEVLNSYGFDVHTTSLDRILFYGLYRELLEKYSLAMQLLCTKDGVHLNTLFRSVYYLKIHDNSLYLRLIPRIKKFLDIYRIKILVYGALDGEISMLNEIGVVYNIYPEYGEFILTIKKTLCQ